MTRAASFLAALLVAIVPRVASGAASPETKCQAAKNRASGAYARCLHEAEAKLALSGDAAKYATAVAKCSDAVAAGFAKAEAAAARTGGACAATDDAGPIAEAVADTAGTVAAALAPGGALPTCGNDAIDTVGEQCDGIDLGGASCATFGLPGGTLGCDDACRLDTAACEGTCGDGAINAVGEQCDLADLGGATCETLGHAAGTLACDASCRFAAAGCDDCEGGIFRDGGCWFLSTLPLVSCDEVCAVNGRVCDEARTRAVGSGGTAEACRQHVVAIAPVAAVNSNFDQDWSACTGDAGMGCAFYSPEDTTPATPVYSERTVAPVTTCTAIGFAPPSCLSRAWRVCACD
jgi:hypothetical protein